MHIPIITSQSNIHPIISSKIPLPEFSSLQLGIFQCEYHNSASANPDISANDADFVPSEFTNNLMDSSLFYEHLKMLVLAQSCYDNSYVRDLCIDTYVSNMSLFDSESTIKEEVGN